MASRPAISSRYTKFLGLDLLSDPTKLSDKQGGMALLKATNVDITNDFSIKRRDGYYLFSSGNYTSIWGNNLVCYAVNNGDLVEIFEDGSESLIRSGVGTTRMSFADTLDGFVYFTNGAVIGKISDGIAYDLSGTVEKFKGTLQPGKFLAYIPPRLVVAKGSVLYISEPRNKDIYHHHQGFIQFKSDIRMVAPIGKSIFVSDSKYTYFLQKMSSPLDVPAPMYRVDRIANYPSIEGDNFRYTDFGIKTGLKFYPYAILWVSKRGICIGDEAGGFENLTEKKYPMPDSMQTVASEIRQEGDLNIFLTTIKGI